MNDGTWLMKIKVYEWMNEWMSGMEWTWLLQIKVYEWINEWMDEWINDWMNELHLYE